MLYAHGTGGNYRTMLGSGNEAESLAARCIATMGVDQIFHGMRPGAGMGSPELLFFNVVNPVAGRANAAQSAIDVVQQARLFGETHFTIPAEISGRGAPIPSWSASTIPFSVATSATSGSAPGDAAAGFPASAMPSSQDSYRPVPAVSEARSRGVG